MTLNLHFIIQMYYEQYVDWNAQQFHICNTWNCYDTNTYQMLQNWKTSHWEMEKTLSYLSWDIASSGNVAFFVTKECSWTTVIRLLTISISWARFCNISLQFLISLVISWTFCNKINENMLVTPRPLHKIPQIDHIQISLKLLFFLFQCTMGSP